LVIPTCRIHLDVRGSFAVSEGSKSRASSHQ
jgi:hypothetical protein